MHRWLIGGALAGMLASLALAWAVPARADVYKCVIDDTVAYQDIPCGGELVELEGITVLGEARAPERPMNPLVRAQEARTRAVNEAFQNLPAMKQAHARKERVDRAVINGRIATGMSEAEARLVYGAPFDVRLDRGGCRRLTWRNPDHAARVCANQVVSIGY